MRVTNPMITNGMMLNINRNAASLNKYYNQLSTGKKVQVPSDDPILASRALKFRTNVSETEQYLKNVAQGTSWMEVTEAAYNNINNIFFRIRDLAARGANDTLTFEDRDKVTTEISSLFEQLGHEINATYAGRYVFSGYRTDTSPTISETSDSMDYDIEQAYRDDQVTKGFVPSRMGGVLTDPPQETAWFNVAYENIGALGNNSSFTGNSSGIVTVSMFDDNAYSPGNYIKETGQLILGLDANGKPDVSVLPILDNLKDPMLDYSTGTAQELFYYDGVPVPGGAVPVVGATKNGFQLYTNDDGTGEQAYNEYSPTLRGVNYTKKGFIQGNLHPEIYFVAKNNETGTLTSGKNFNSDIYNQQQFFEVEFSVNTRVRINSNAGDVFTDKAYGDLHSMIEEMKYINRDTREAIRNRFEQGTPPLYGEELEDAVAQEVQKIQIVSQDRFSTLIGKCDTFIAEIAREHTDLGTRMDRLELIKSRLEDDRVNYMKLLSDNEDVDYAETMMRLSSLEAVYQASLKTGSNIIQMTLATYI
ncbi:hypothetical protein FACS1894188_03470 [Clostridia bacterium]|nr:hypothetical protein FACS1894188_03470 [Clostridia bacterium]